MSNSVLRVDKLSHSYFQAGQELQILQEISFDLPKGEIVGLLGASGAGKSTLLHLVGLLDKPTNGEIYLFDEAVSGLSQKKRTLLRREKIGFVYQFHYLLAEFSALENVMIPMMLDGTSKSKAKSDAKDLLHEVGLDHRLTHRPSQLSGGEQQRVAIARALANRPQLLLADEPTGNLDENTTEEIFSLLLKMAKEREVLALIATHNLDLAARMDHCLKLKGRHVVDDAA